MPPRRGLLRQHIDSGSAQVPATERVEQRRTIHQVAPVTRGVRLVGITWIQSWVADAHERELLLQLDEARSLELATRKDPRMTVLLESLRTNLFRKWSDT